MSRIEASEEMVTDFQKEKVAEPFSHTVVAPKTWAKSTLGEVVDFVGGSQPPKSKFMYEEKPDSIRLIQIRDYKSDNFKVYIPKELAKKFCDVNDVMIGRYGPPIFQILRGLGGAYNVALMKAVPSVPLLDNNYLFYYLKNPNLFRFVEAGSDRTAGQSGVNKKLLLKYPFFLPPLSEQKRIVEKLDCLLAKVDACKTRLEKLPEIIKRFRQSVLTDAVSGKLTEDWREERNIKDISETWFNYPLESLAANKNIFDGPFGSNLKTADYTESGGRVVRLENIGHLKFIGSKKTFISIEKYEDLKKHTLREDDILFSSFLADEVRICRMPRIDGPAINKADCFCIRVDNEKVISRYLEFSLASHQTYLKLKKLVHGATRPRINLRQLKKFTMTIPPVREQSEIVLRVDSLFSVADQLYKKLETARLRVEKLTASILSKAFRGKIVPQDPNDEPADVLLNRIRAEREALAENKKRGGRTSKKRSGRGKRTKPQKADAEVEPEPEAMELGENGIDKEKDREVVSRILAVKQTHKHFEMADVLKAFRKAIFHQTDIDEYTLLRHVGQRLGTNRLSKQIRHELESYIKTAIRRKIIARNGDGYDSATPTIHHYDEKYLINALKSLIRKGYEYQRSHVVENLAVYLGYDKVSDAFDQRMKTIFRLAIRRGELYRNGAYVGKF